MRNCTRTIPHLLYIYVRTLFCVNKYIVPKIYILMCHSVTGHMQTHRSPCEGKMQLGAWPQRQVSSINSRTFWN